MPKILHRYCPNCFTDNSDVAPLLVTHPEWPLKACRKCRFVYLERVLPYEEIKKALAHRSRVKTAEGEPGPQAGATCRLAERPVKPLMPIRLRRDKLSSLVNRYIKKGPLLDVGCGDGGTLARLPSLYTKIGIEISQPLAQAAQRAVPPATIIHDDAISGMRRLSHIRLNGVIMSSFLDYEIEPRWLLHETCQMMNAGGILILKVQNYHCWRRKLSGSRWRGFRLPDRVNYFTPHSIVSIARSTGFAIQRFRFDDRWPINDNMWVVLEKPTAASPRPVSIVSPRRCTRLEWI